MLRLQKMLTRPEKIPPTGIHDFISNFQWHAEYQCAVDFCCMFCGKHDYVVCDVTTATTPDEGLVYTATATRNGETYTESRSDASFDDMPGSHVSSNRWGRDQDGHWMLCLFCDEILKEGPHQPDGEATLESSQRCEYCGYVLQIPHRVQWILDLAKQPGNYIWASGTYARIMDQYGTSQTD